MRASRLEMPTLLYLSEYVKGEARMSAEFPYLNDSKFPGLRNVNAFRSSSRFDYSRWGVGTVIKVLNVNWCGDYENVVKFDDDAARDKWFDSAPGDTVRIETEQRILPAGSIRLPLPFDECCRYNYVMVDFSMATSAGEPLPFETDEHINRFFFFLRSPQFVSANCTECSLSMDAWTTFINKIEIKYMMLERGHAPMAAVSADAFLSDPVKNNRLLLADDVSYGDPVIPQISYVQPYDAGASAPYVLFATTVPLDLIDELGRTQPAQLAAPGYYNDGTRSGYQAGLLGPAFAAGGVDYSDLSLYTQSHTTFSGAISNNLTVFAVAAPDCFGGGFIDAIVDQIPQFLQTIQATFVVPSNFISLTTPHQFLKRTSMTWRQLAATGKTWVELSEAGHTYTEVDENAAIYFGSGETSFTIYEVEPSNTRLIGLHPGKDSFQYPAEYAEIAKLYTFPYAAIKLTDDTGKTATIRVEETTPDLQLSQRVSLAYPYLRFEAFVEGIGKGSSESWKWVDLRGNERWSPLPCGSFHDAMFGYDIPTFSLFMSGYEDYRLHNYNTNNVVALNAARVAYENAAHSANNARENALDSAGASYENVDASATTGRQNAQAAADASYQNSNDSASVAYGNALRNNSTSYENALRGVETGLGNANRSAAAGKTSADASADVAFSNTSDSASASRANADRSADLGETVTRNSNEAAVANVQLAVAASQATNAATNAQNSDVTGYNNGLMQANQAWDAGYARAMNGLDNINAAITSVTSGAASVLQAATVPPTVKAVDSDASITSTAIGAVANTINTAINIGFSVAKTEEGISNSQHKVTESQQNATDTVQRQIETSTANLATSNEFQVAGTNNSVNAALANAVSEKNVAKQNNSNSYDTSIGNATRSRSVTLASNERTYGAATANAAASADTGRTNAASSKATANQNAHDARDVALANAKRSYDAATANASRSAALARGNAANSRDTAIGNATSSRDVALANAQRELELRCENARAAYLDHRLDPPVEIGERSGDATPDELRWRGIQIQYLTQPLGEIAQAGDQMLRYGYYLNQAWRVDNLNVMPNFSYWKASDIWLTGGAGVQEDAQEAIKSAIKRGVTVWRDPEKIGEVSIYDN